MFIAALSIAELWREPKYPLTDEWIKKMWYFYTVEYFSATKKRERETSHKRLLTLGNKLTVDGGRWVRDGLEG